MTAVADRTSDHTLRIGVDTGGTFTDVVLFDPGAGTVTITKTPSTPDDPARGFMAGVLQILARVGGDGKAVASVSHGTTVATNALLTDDYAGLGFVTTDGFRHLLEIARQSVPEGYGNSYFWVKPPRIVPLHHVREVAERLGPEGEVVRRLDEDAAVEVADDLPLGSEALGHLPHVVQRHDARWLDPEV